VWLPTLREEVDRVAVPELSVPVPSVVPPSLKVTVPLGEPAPGDCTDTDAVNVTDCPKTRDTADVAKPVAVDDLLTVCVNVPELVA
jgi:hypothetical protein